MDRDNFIEDLRKGVTDPIMEAWEESGKKISFETYLSNRNEEAKRNGFESAYDEYYSNLAKSRERSKKKTNKEKEPAE